MRLLVCLFALAACQHADSAERSAEIIKNAPAPAVAAAPAPAPMPMHEGHACGGACGASCNGQCGPSCGGESPTFQTPDNASWTALHVTGMHCGGCARRIERALAGVKGVVGVKADFSQAKVEVATVDGVDAKKLVATTIDGLGYRVE